MKVKRKLLATFVPNDKIEWFIDYLEIKHSLPKERVHIFKNLDDNNFIVTFSLESDGYINLRNFIYQTVIIHKKGGAIYTINALNELIKLLNGGVVDIRYRVNWQHYRNTILLTQHNELKQLKTKIHQIIEL